MLVHQRVCLITSRSNIPRNLHRNFRKPSVPWIPKRLTRPVAWRFFGRRRWEFWDEKNGDFNLLDVGIHCPIMIPLFSHYEIPLSMILDDRRRIGMKSCDFINDQWGFIMSWRCSKSWGTPSSHPSHGDLGIHHSRKPPFIGKKLGLGGLYWEYNRQIMGEEWDTLW